MRYLRSCVALAVSLWMASCAAGEQPHTGTPLSIEALNPVLVVGLDELDPMTSFTHVQDAAFVGEGIAVLDVSPPFLRVFDQSGRPVASLVPEGQGPGEARRPSGVVPFDSGYLITEIGRVSHIDASGRLLRSFNAPGQRVRGAVAGCKDEVLLLTTPVASVDGSGAILRYRDGAEAADTIMAIDSVRANSRQVHPLFAARSSEAISIYPEDVSRRRLLRYDCPGGKVSELQIDSLGRQEWWEVSESGGYLLHPPEAPWPAGVAVLDGDLVWGVQDVRRNGQAEDSITRFAKYTSEGVTAVLEVRGWYQILDVSASGRVLLTSPFPVGHVTVLEAGSLKKAMQPVKGAIER